MKGSLRRRGSPLVTHIASIFMRGQIIAAPEVWHQISLARCLSDENGQIGLPVISQLSNVVEGEFPLNKLIVRKAGHHHVAHVLQRWQQQGIANIKTAVI